MGLAVIFGGQGNQYPEMFAKFKSEVDQTNFSLISDKLGISLEPQISLDSAKLFSNEYAQPLIASHGYLVWECLKSKLSTPVAMAGYSLGELTAISCAAEFTLDTLLDIAINRAKFMSENSAIASGLVAVSGIHIQQMEQLCTESNCFIAIRNSTQNLIIGGKLTDLDICCQKISQCPGQIHTQKLQVAVASHTPLLYSASENFRNYLETYNNGSLDCKIVSGIDAQVQYRLSGALSALSSQISQTINFDRVIRVLSELGAEAILEIGPGRALGNIVKQQNLPLVVKSVDDFKNLNEVATWAAKYTQY